jgi:lysozyme family protein
MKTNFKECLAFVLLRAGGFKDNRNPEKAKNRGITLRAYRQNYGSIMDLEDLKNIPRKHVEHIYRSRYWNKVGANAYPPGVDCIVFSAAVDKGVYKALKWLQKAVGVKPDGILGDVTIEAVKACEHPYDIIKKYMQLREGFFRRLFGKLPGSELRKMLAAEVTGLRMHNKNYSSL